MAPTARVVVYFVREDGEVVADAVNFDVDGTFQNFVRPFFTAHSSLPNLMNDALVFRWRCR